MGYSIAICVISIIVAIICIIKLQNKQHLDRSEKNRLEQDVRSLKNNKELLQNELSSFKKQIEEERQRFNFITDQNNKTLARQSIDIDNFYEKTKARRLEQLENEISQQEKIKKELLAQNLQEETKRYEESIDIVAQAFNDAAKDYEERVNKLAEDTKFQQERFNSLLAPLQQYEKDRMAKLFYTIQVPDEYKNDIDYLLNTVSEKVQHPDIINKLVWAEYIKPYIDETFKRVGIEPKSGIYKITNIDDGKGYIGKSTDIKKRLTDHFKSSIGITSIADQAIHHAILKQGFWNWAIEPILYCEKDKLSEMEKYYINFFKTQEFGYNKREGG